jgi:putative heme transporter
VAGIAGALIAVPACAVAYHAVLGYRANDDEAGPSPDSRTDADTEHSEDDNA